jgi:hypothetical protein
MVLKMPNARESTPPNPERLQAPVARFLRPLVSLLIRSGITFPALTNMLRELYVNVAEYDFALPGKEQTDSRVSLLTGIHRKEVRRLRGAGAPVSTVPASLSRTSHILSQWLAAPEFTDARGRPLLLPRTTDEPSMPSFESLVVSVTRDVRPRAVLDEWLDRGLVTIDAEDRVVLTETAVIPPAGSEQQLYYFGRNLHDHAAAAVANVLHAEPRFMERAVHYDRISEKLARKLEQRSREVGAEMLREINREAHAACETDPGGTSRWTFGIYVYREAVTDEATQSPSSKGAPEAAS